MTDVAGRSKGPPPQSDLSQALAHGPALSQAYGPRIGALLLLVAIIKARSGPIGIAAGASFAAYALYQVFLKH
jgi:hypothetical protein